MKLIIQIPCFNESDQIADTLAAIPKTVEGVDVVETLVIDDGSTDGTAKIARAAGADHFVQVARNQGLAKTFMTGLEACLERGADIIVNCDADNQYDASAIPALVAPIIKRGAGLVVGERLIAEIEHFSPLKRKLQHLGSWAVRRASRVDVGDAPSGFRAFDRETALSLYVFSSYTYTLETLIQAGRMGIPIETVPVGVNPPTRPSRLIRSMWSYVLRSAWTIIRIFILYNPLKFFSVLSVVLAIPGIIAFVRFLIFYLQGDGGGHTQSLIAGAVFLVMASVTMAAGLIADLVAANRVLLAEIRKRQIKARLDNKQ
ncbi:MAG: glycosyltransferase family 2 protein [Paracoccaceae bacterium]|nr:glycosyltransferase family 2 protein [Paracoccaceae bacterium]MDG1368959.1 glycosyltransferase family 2 protein [Paracoccaceae bacterium]